jgi:hypothetical protein
MGTNYYTRTNACKECGRYDQIHLGKSSAGWRFTFQGNHGQYYKDVPEMKKWLKGKTITDEYGNTLSYKAFWGMVSRKQKEIEPEIMPHASYLNGYTFINREFS